MSQGINPACLSLITAIHVPSRLITKNTLQSAPPVVAQCTESRLRSRGTPRQLDTKLTPLRSPAGSHDLFCNSFLNALAIAAAILRLNKLHVPRFPMQTDKTGDEQFGALTTGTGLP